MINDRPLLDKESSTANEIQRKIILHKLIRLQWDQFQLQPRLKFNCSCY